MNGIFTGLFTFLALCAVAGAFLAAGSAREAHNVAARLRTRLARSEELEGEVASMGKALRKLQGSYYRQRAIDNPPEPPQPESADEVRARLRKQLPLKPVPSEEC